MTDRLVFFEIDEKVIDSGRAGTRALHRIFIMFLKCRKRLQRYQNGRNDRLQIIREGPRI
ncbi:hypothetical protein BMS3Abin15_01262 [bacterium BMS3Abin15]|nr:hypothetical protein BMS3Abin15_01262 [bacterium BMS3Abin15]